MRLREMLTNAEYQDTDDNGRLDHDSRERIGATEG